MTDKLRARDVYDAMADEFAARVREKPHNAYYERPATLSLLPDVRGLKALDAGCGPGVYCEELTKRGAIVAACDISPRMIEQAKARKLENARFFLADLAQPLTQFSDAEFDLVLAPLSLDYIDDWRAVFVEFRRLLKPGGFFIMSAGHPSFEAEYFATEDYFSVESVSCVWRGFGKPVEMPSYRRSIEEFFTPFADAGFVIEKVLEPRPTEDFQKADPKGYEELMRRPAFLCVRARNP